MYAYDASRRLLVRRRADSSAHCTDSINDDSGCNGRVGSSDDGSDYKRGSAHNHCRSAYSRAHESRFGD